MSRKTFVTIISVLFVIVVVGLIGGYFYLTHTKTINVPAPSAIGGLSSDQINNGSSATTNGLASTTLGNLPRLRQITNTPVAGYDFVDMGKGYVVWYVDRGNGNVFQTATSTLDITRITNTTIPKVYEASIGKGGSNIILRMLYDDGDTIQTFIGTLKNNTSTSSDNQTKSLTGIFLGDTLSQISLSPNKDSLFGITSTSNQGMGNIYSFGGKSSNIFTHPLKDWIPQWINTNTIALTSTPSAKTQNISFFLNTKTGGLTKTIGPKNGLVVSSSPDASHLLFSENKNNTLVFGMFDVKSQSETPLSNPTIPDKCVWSKQTISVVYCGFPKGIPNGLYPDDWYKGKVFFDDTIGSFDTKTSQFTSYIDLKKESGTSIDATNLVLSKDNKYLLFTNKRDLTLWMLSL